MMKGTWAAVRKFSLEYCDFPTMLSNVSSMLRVLALNVDGRNDKGIPVVCIILTAVSSIFYFYSYVLSGYWFTFWRSRELGDLTGAFIEFSLNVTSEIVVIRLFYMMFYEKKLKRLTEKYLEFDARITSGTRYSINMLKTMRKVKRRGIIFWWILMLDAAVYIIKPLVTPGPHLTVDNFVIYGLEPMLESPNLEIATILMTISITFICYGVASITCFLILMIGYIEAQLLALSEELTHLWKDAKHHSSNISSTIYNPINVQSTIREITEAKVMNDYINKHLVGIVGRHAMTRSNLQEIEELMRVPNVIGFLLLIMGLIAELLAGLEQTYLQLPFTMLQLSVDCYLGQKVMDANLVFERAVYGCKWEMFNDSNRKVVLVMLQNSQKTMTLTAGGMATLSFRCLMSIIKTTYSAYTTLTSMV